MNEKDKKTIRDARNQRETYGYYSHVALSPDNSLV